MQKKCPFSLCPSPSPNFPFTDEKRSSPAFETKIVITSGPETAQNVLKESQRQIAEPHTGNQGFPLPKSAPSQTQFNIEVPWMVDGTFWREQNAAPFAQRPPEVFLHTLQRFFRFILCKNKPDRPKTRS
ncbi:hypothetical protein CDAR_97181 [Caerostris darwini]|uniref:Uncharacterized protein n=1 Tax=Caerostris darwini TaxID=1538125 RepID=A0AAV4QN70_9ARAC|nr:hypothetical protein CDAR_97181 [Caerostris darwini]